MRFSRGSIAFSVLVASAILSCRARRDAEGNAPCPEGMARLPGGSFKVVERGPISELVRGRAPLYFPDPVTVESFCMDLTEVTVDAYAQCMRAGRCGADSPAQPGRAECNYGAPERGNHPVNCVDWAQAASYCSDQGKRLPTSEEWEWAARGGNRGWTYPWGNGAPGSQLCWSGLSHRNGTCPVASFPEGDAPGGIHDLAGNVWEWTSSPHEDDGRVVRGGGWVNNHTDEPAADSQYYVRAAHGESVEPSARYRADLGFRCVRSP